MRWGRGEGGVRWGRGEGGSEVGKGGGGTCSSIYFKCIC